MYYPYKVILDVTYSDGSVKSFEDFGNEKDQSMFVFTAKRILQEKAGIKDSNVVAQRKIDSLPVDDIPQEIKKTWPKNMKTIRVFYFTYTQASK